jgi:hypothetical protein
MSQVKTRKAKNQAVVGPTPASGPYSLNTTNMSSCDGKEHYIRYDAIYDMFQT